MSGPLSPKSLSAHNRMESAPNLHDVLKSPIHAAKSVADQVDKISSIADGPPSSPFQTEVEQENRVPVEFMSPIKRSSPEMLNLSASKSFVIHQDDLEDDSILLFSTQNTPGPHPEPGTSPIKTLAIEALPEQDKEGEEPRFHTDEIIPPQSMFDIDYSDVPRQSHDMTIDFDIRTAVSEDTCFSTFSAIPNADMTLFANIGNLNAGLESSRRQGLLQRQTHNTHPTSSKKAHHPSSRSPSPTPRRVTSNSRDGDTTNLLLDFTQQFETFPQRTLLSPQRRGGLSPVRMKTEPSLLSYINNQRQPSPGKTHPTTPGAGRRSVMNLLDFDLPPQPTPRSIPSITVRELESLKSSYLSEISSLKASLSGKEAEVGSLKKAVTDAERRVGEALETVREERNAREHAEQEKGEWEKKGKEVEGVLQTVKEEFEITEKEREELLQKLEESNQAREDAERRAVEAAARSGIPLNTTGEQSVDANHSTIDALVAHRVAQQLDEKMENLARELHAVYKKKHETKVATLKKTYEARGEKKCQELQQKVEELSKELLGSAATSINGQVETGLNLKEHEAEILRHESHASHLMDEIEELKQTQGRLLRELEGERAEKGDLVAAVDEMLALQADGHASAGTDSAVVEGFRKSIGLARPSGLRAPGGFGSERRMGGTAPSYDRTNSKSRMMHNIERMGGGRANNE